MNVVTKLIIPCVNKYLTLYTIFGIGNVHYYYNNNYFPFVYKNGVGAPCTQSMHINYLNIAVIKALQVCTILGHLLLLTIYNYR